jgi:alanyl-tRNA synthetase
MEQQAYLTDPLTLEFEGKILHQTEVAGGQVEVVLEKTYFYPTGGGQPHDTGTLGNGQVVDVFKDEAGNVVHRVDREITGPIVTGRIDRERRLGHMQHHSAQHILSRVVEELLGLETLSAKISADSPSTVDVPDVEVSWSDLARVERRVNRIVCENRAIKTYVITDDQIETVPFRRPPKVSGQIRVVEVDSFDYSACGATHCPSTGMIGLIKILRTERKNKKLRLHFVAGNQALTYFQQYQDVVTEICQHLSTSPEEVAGIVQLQSAQLQATEREIKELRSELLSFEAEKLVAQAEPVGEVELVTKLYQNWSVGELRELAKLLQTQEKLVAVLAGYDGQKLAVVVSCADGTGVSAKELLAKHLAQIDGKGGGDARVAQGGGAATAQQVEQFFVNSRGYL